MFRWLHALFAAPSPTPKSDPLPLAVVGNAAPTTSADTLDWLRRMPPKVLAVDVETTGLAHTDRIVSFGGILLETPLLAQRSFELKFNHLVFNPGRNSHPMAQRVHGFSDWALKQQEAFAEEADTVSDLIDAADMLVAHNAEFDIGFLNRELVAIGRPKIKQPTYCTMTEWRRRAMPGSANLTNVAAFFGLSRASERHGALEDAWLALMIYLRFSGCALTLPFGVLNNQGPINLRPIPPEPWQSMLETNPAKAIVEAKRGGYFGEAEAWLLNEIERCEAQARETNNWPPPPWPYEQLAVLYRQRKRIRDEVAIITRYLSLPSADHPRVSKTVRKLQDRLGKAMDRLRRAGSQNPPPVSDR